MENSDRRSYRGPGGRGSFRGRRGRGGSGRGGGRLPNPPTTNGWPGNALPTPPAGAGQAHDVGRDAGRGGGRGPRGHGARGRGRGGRTMSAPGRVGANAAGQQCVFDSNQGRMLPMTGTPGSGAEQQFQRGGAPLHNYHLRQQGGVRHPGHQQQRHQHQQQPPRPEEGQEAPAGRSQEARRRSSARSGGGGRGGGGRGGGRGYGSGHGGGRGQSQGAPEGPGGRGPQLGGGGRGGGRSGGGRGGRGQSQGAPEGPGGRGRHLGGRGTEAQRAAAADRRRRRRPDPFDEYKEWSEIALGFKQQTVFQGKIRINPRCFRVAYVTVEGGLFPWDLVVEGPRDRNRALEGDAVAVELLPQEKWEPVDKKDSDEEDEESKQAPSELPDESELDVAISELGALSVRSSGVDEEEENGKEEDEEEDDDEEEEGNAADVTVEIGAAELDALDLHGPGISEAAAARPWENDEVQDALWKPRVALQEPGAGATDPEAALCPAGREALRLRLKPLCRVVQIVEKRKEEDVMGMLSPNGERLAKSLREGDQIPKGEDFVLFTPADLRAPRMLIPRMEVPEDYLRDPFRHRATVYLVRRKRRWPARLRMPLGERVRPLGEAGELSVETEALEAEFGVGHGDFPPAVVADLCPFLPDAGSHRTDAGQYATSSEWRIPPEEYAARRDFRGHRIFSIDPTTAKDLDDALHVAPCEDGTVEIGVHIADVSYFVREGTALDAEARARATTVYLVQKVTPMLPPLLCEELCSLNPRVDRLAYSCVWWMNRDGSLADREPWYGRSVINSCAKLDYDTAQRMIDGEIAPGQAQVPEELWASDRRPAGGPSAWAAVIEDVRLLNEVARRRRRTRFAHGALALNSVKLCFRLDGEGNPCEYFTYPIKESNQLVEEYMLLANFLVAQQLVVRAGPRALIRMHPPPMERGVKEFVRLAELYGHRVDVASAGALQASLARVLRRTRDPFVPEVLIALATRPMKPAKYISAGAHEMAQWRHYALNIPYYTHFTSPIRRYADVMVHRLLTATLEGDPGAVDRFYAQQREVEEICTTCNDKKMMSKKAQERSDQVFFAVFLKDHPQIEEGIVIGIGEKSFTVLVPRLGIEQRIYVDDIPHGYGDGAGLVVAAGGHSLLVCKATWNKKEQTILLAAQDADPGNGGGGGDRGSPVPPPPPRAGAAGRPQRAWRELEVALFAKVVVLCTARTRRRIEVALELVGRLEGEPTFHTRRPGFGAVDAAAVDVTAAEDDDDEAAC